MEIWIILGWILASLIGLFGLLLLIVWILLPFYYRKSYSKELDGSYNPITDLWHTPLVEKNQVSSDLLTEIKNKGSLRIHIGDISFAPNNHQKSDDKPTANSLEHIDLVNQKELKIDIPVGTTSGHQDEWLVHSDKQNIRIITKVYVLENIPGILCQLELPDGFEYPPPPVATEGQSSTPNPTFNDKLNFLFPVFTNDSMLRRNLTFQETVFSPPTNHFTTAFAPVVLFDDQGQSIVMCAVDQYFVTGFQSRQLDGDTIGARFEYGFGIKNATNPLPKGYRQSCIIFRSNGIGTGLHKLGEFLRSYHKLPTKSLTPDILNKWLGYFTDNGAAYYYNTVPGVKADETLRRVDQQAKKLNLPYHYYHLDSWWYQKSTSPRKQRYLGKLSSLLGGSLYGGTLLWEIDPHYFDISLSVLSKELGKPFSAHNRWYESGSPYVNQFNFHKRGIYAMPDDQAFFDKLMRECNENQIIVYEQDWMSTQFKRFPYFASELGACERWLNQMGSAAMKYNRTIQYCMETPACVLYSQFIPCVTHGRACDDYHGWAYHNYDVPAFTQASILFDAMGLRPFKDVFKTTKRGRYRGENSPLLMTIVASLSTGPVGPGDEIGYENVDLIMASCTANGLLLQPDRPLCAVDTMFLPHKSYYVAATSTQIANLQWWYVLTANLFPERVQQSDYLLSEMIPELQSLNKLWIEYDWETRATRKIEGNAKIGQKLKSDQFCYRVYAPLLSNGAAILGTPSKICMINQNYLKNFEEKENGITLMMQSPSPETIDFCCYLPVSVKIEKIKVLDSTANVAIPFDFNSSSLVLTCHMKIENSNLHQIKVSWN